MKKLLFLIFLVSLFISCSNGETKIGYVENFQLYSEFDMTKEYQSELEIFATKSSNELDSLKFSLQQYSERFETMEHIPSAEFDQFNLARSEFSFKQSAYEQELAEKSQEYDRQIWERLNLFIQEYAEQNDYDFILGANGNGNLMFAKKSTDLTTKLIEFSNKNYRGH